MLVLLVAADTAWRYLPAPILFPSGTRWWHRMTKDLAYHGIIWSVLGSPDTNSKACSSPGQGHCGPGGTPVLHEQLWRGVCVWWFWSNCQQQGMFPFLKSHLMTLLLQHQQSDGVLRVSGVVIHLILCFCSRTWNQQHLWTTSGAMTSGEATWVATLVTNPTDLSLSLHLGNISTVCAPTQMLRQ